jgi:hypothetical protein
MDPRLRRRARIEAGLAVLGGCLLVLTLIFPTWIEAITGLEPDAGSGELELFIAGALLLISVASALLARRDYRRLALEEN